MRTIRRDLVQSEKRNHGNFNFEYRVQVFSFRYSVDHTEFIEWAPGGSEKRGVAEERRDSGRGRYEGSSDRSCESESLLRSTYCTMTR